MKTAAIIQARTGSSRLPGKVLKSLGEKTILEWVIERVKSAKKISVVAVATTYEKRDDEIFNIAQKIGVKCYRGSEQDVLLRFKETAEFLNLHDSDLIVRITADCPLIDPEIIDETVKFHTENRNDYTNNVVDRGYFPRGFDTEVFSFGLLKTVEKMATSLYDKEHVTTYIRSNDQKFRIGYYKAKGIFKRPDMKLCVDTHEDYERVQLIVKKLKDSKITAKNIIKLFEKPRIAVVCEGNEQIGTGHVIRPLKIMEYLSDMLDFEASFFVNDNEKLIKKINKAGYDTEIYELKKTKKEKTQFIKEIISKKYDFVLVDLFEIFQKDTADMKERIFSIDENYALPEMALLSRNFESAGKKEINKTVKKILVTFGGSDPNNLTSRTLEALSDLNFNITVVLGVAFNSSNEIKKIKTKNMKILSDVQDMSEIMSNADIAICNAGTTMYELCYLGVPCIVISQTSYESKGAEDMEKRGAAINLGFHEKINRKKIKDRMIELINDYEKRKEMSSSGKKYVKNASQKVANKIIESIIPK